MASAWGASWGSAWGNSWGVITPEEVSGGVNYRKRIDEEEEMMYMVAAMLPLIIRRTNHGAN